MTHVLDPRCHGLCDLGSRSKQATLCFGERADCLGDELFAHPGHQPIGPLIAHAPQGLDRDGHGDTITRGTRVELVGQGKTQLALHPVIGEARAGLAEASGKKKFGRVVQKLWIRAFLVLPPAVEVPGGNDRRRKNVVKEAFKRHFIGDEAVGAAPTLRFACALDRLVVAPLEGVALTPLTLNKGMADEHLAGKLSRSDGNTDSRCEGRVTGHCTTN